MLVAARDEERSIEATVSALRAAFPDADVLVADDGSRDGPALPTIIEGLASMGYGFATVAALGE